MTHPTYHPSQFYTREDTKKKVNFIVESVYFCGVMEQYVWLETGSLCTDSYVLIGNETRRVERVQWMLNLNVIC